MDIVRDGNSSPDGRGDGSTRQNRREMTVSIDFSSKSTTFQ